MPRAARWQPDLGATGACVEPSGGQAGNVRRTAPMAGRPLHSSRETAGVGANSDHVQRQFAAHCPTDLLLAPVAVAGPPQPWDWAQPPPDRLPEVSRSGRSADRSHRMADPGPESAGKPENLAWTNSMERSGSSRRSAGKGRSGAATTRTTTPSCGDEVCDVSAQPMCGEPWAGCFGSACFALSRSTSWKARCGGSCPTREFRS